MGMSGTAMENSGVGRNYYRNAPLYVTAALAALALIGMGGLAAGDIAARNRPQEAIVRDYNGDGRNDILITSSNGYKTLFVDDGKGELVRVEGEAANSLLSKFNSVKAGK